MPQKTLWNQIEQIFNDKKDPYWQLANYFYQNKNDLNSISQDQILKDFDYSELTLNRFAKIFDCLNLEDLIIQIKNLAQKNDFKAPHLRLGIIQHINFNMIKAYEVMTKQEKILDDLIKQLQETNHLYFLGVGNHFNVVQAFSQKLNHLGFSTRLINQKTVPLDLIKKFKVKDQVFVFDFDFTRQELNALFEQIKTTPIKIIHIGAKELDDPKLITFRINYKKYLKEVSFGIEIWSLLLFFETLFQKIISLTMANFEIILKQIHKSENGL